MQVSSLKVNSVFVSFNSKLASLLYVNTTLLQYYPKTCTLPATLAYLLLLYYLTSNLYSTRNQMNELDRLRQEAEALKSHIRDARKNVRDCTMESKTENVDNISRLNMRARRLVVPFK